MENMEYKGIKFSIGVDTCCNESPRDISDHFGTMVCNHNRYNLGDEQAENCEAYSSWANWFKHEIGKNVIALPLYLYDHGGVTISTVPFSCSWDSGQVGYIYINKDKVRKEFNVKRISQKLKTQVLETLVDEVKDYDYYIRGEVYCYQIDNEDNDSCFGYYGEEEAIRGAKETIDYLLNKGA